ncbi:family A1 protease [Lactarius quietus]|nr:family A1 protease [Lactarius quietus]
MFPITSFTTILLLVAGVAAKPVVVHKSPVSLSFAQHFNITGARDLVKKDQARAKHLVSIGRAQKSGIFRDDAVVGAAVTNVATFYQASVGIGSRLPLVNNLLIDTGSANTWVGAGKAYVQTSTSVQTDDSVSVSYGSGSFSGAEYLDTVTIADGLVIPQQSIGIASQSTGFDGFDGILGIGPVDLTLGTLSPNTQSTIPTVTDNLFSQGTITSDVLSVSFEPTTSTSVQNGELTFGGTDSSRYTGAITFVPITSTSPANTFWGIDQSIRYGVSTNILSDTAGIVDTGTTLILIATDAFEKYQSATGATLDNGTGLLRITSTQFNTLESLFFTTGGIWPRALNTLIGGSSGNIYLVVSDLGTPSGQGLDFINGYTFLERFYSVYDTANNRVGLATTPFTTATTN